MDQPVPTIAVELPKINRLLFSLIGIAILIVGVVVGFLIGKYIYSPKIVQIPIPIVSTSPSPSVANPPLAETPSADVTSTWKTYSRIANFTFQFPNDWTEQPNYSLQSGNKLMTVWIEGDTVGLECLALTKSLKKSVNESVFDLKYYDGIKSASCDTSGNKIIFFLFPVGNKKYSFTFDYSDSNKEVSEKLFDQILSTFKFTDKDNTKKCFSDKDCPDNSFCDYSTPGGMGPNGFVSGQPYGSQQCILKCQNNDQCSSNQCQTFEVVTGDINNSQKGCKP